MTRFRHPSSPLIPPPQPPSFRTPFRTRRQDTGDRALISLAGEIDMDSAPELSRSLARCLREGIRTVDVDLSAVIFCDCSGLNAFLSASLLTRRTGGTLRLHHPAPSVARLFALAGCGTLFPEAPGIPAGLCHQAAFAA